MQDVKLFGTIHPSQACHCQSPPIQSHQCLVVTQNAAHKHQETEGSHQAEKLSPSGFDRQQVGNISAINKSVAITECAHVFLCGYTFNEANLNLF